MRIASRILLLVSIGILTTSCETTDTKASGTGAPADHKPRFDYWQDGGGACCPHHANEVARKQKQR